MSAASSSVILAGIELGLYNFGGTACQAVGLQLTSATRAGFIIQSTAVLTPAISYLAVSGAISYLAVGRAISYLAVSGAISYSHT